MKKNGFHLEASISNHAETEQSRPVYTGYLDKCELRVFLVTCVGNKVPQIRRGKPTL
jgi:hypothetical protein